MRLTDLLKSRVSVLDDRQRSLGLWCRLATCWAAAGLLGLALVCWQRLGHWSSPLVFPFIVLVALISVLMVGLDILRRRRSPVVWRSLAQQVEARYPELQGRLLTAVQQQPSAGNDLNYLQERLLLETLRHSREHDWAEVIPRERLRVAQLGHWLALGLFAIALVELGTGAQPGSRALHFFDSAVTVTPGDTSIERGNSLVVLARFEGPLPAAVDLVLNGLVEPDHIRLVKSLADPTFGGSVPEVTNSFTYRINYSGRSTRAYTVTVFEPPRLERSDVDLTFPDYTKQAPQHIENTRRLSAVEGSSLDLVLRLNKPVAVARLLPRGNQQGAISLKVQTNQPLAVLKGFPLKRTQSYELQLLDAEGRTNKAPAQFVFDVLTNRPPELKLVSPRNDIRPSPLEEITFQGTVWDDFGVEAYGLGYIVPGQPARYIQLGQGVPGKEKKAFSYVLRLEELQVQPDDLVSWFLWADDLGADGVVRRTDGDLFFAEIRPFEEVFREGQGMEGQGQGGEQSGGNQTARLADLQKQIISATWNLQRRQGGPAPKEPSAPDRTNQPVPHRESNNSEQPAGPALSKVAVAAPLGPGGDSRARAGSAIIAQRFNAGLRLDARTPSPDKDDRTEAANLQTSSAVPLGTKALMHLEPSVETLSYYRVSSAVFAGQVAPTDSTDPGPNPDFRRSRDADRSGSTANNGSGSDAQIVVDAQAEALAQAEAAAERARDARFTTLWNAAIKQMNEALARLKEATNSPAAFKDALAAEQAAYQTLLKLQEHEYQVSRSRNRQGGGSGRQQQMQRQLEELELTQSENRYENQRQAQAPQASQRREQLQVMNRLQELARRQKDLNDRLKELQTALQESKTAEEKAELQRRLKRLQEEEQQMLADVDELRQRMDSPENQSRFADERRQLDQTREDVQRAADAAAQGAASQALASGTRAERQLQQLRDQVRKENSSQFADDLRSMRGQARELARQQQEIQKSLQAENSTDHKSLSAPSDHKELENELNRQRQLMTNLLDRATQVSQQAESSEPLLSSQLYDLIRKFSQDASKDVQESQDDLLSHGLMSRSLMDQLKDESELDGAKLLDITSDMVRRDFLTQADQVAQRVGTRVDDLKHGVERAAESVLGDDTEALRLAKAELDQLTDQLQKEMSAAENGVGQTNQQSQARAGNAENSTENSTGNPGGARQGQRVQNQGQETSSGARQPGPAQLSSDQAGDSSAPDAQQAGGGRENSGAENATPRNTGGSTADSTRNAVAGGDSLGGGPGGPWNFDRILNDQPWRRAGPITGEGYVNWSDRLREIEEIIELPDLRTDVATARERARLLRQSYRKDHKKPDWAVVRLQVINPLAEVRDRIADELARRESDEHIVPIDRDPVPTRYSDLVRRYYEELGKEK